MLPRLPSSIRASERKKGLRAEVGIAQSMIRLYLDHQAEPDAFHTIPDLDGKIAYQQRRIASLQAQLKLLEGVKDGR